MTFHARRLRWRSLQTEAADRLRVSLLSTFTIDPLLPFLGTALYDCGVPAEVSVGPYNQIVQECLTPGSATERAAPEVVVVWPRLEELWAGEPWPLIDDGRRYEDLALELADQCVQGARQWQATLVFALPCLPHHTALGVGDAGVVTGVTAIAEATRVALREHLADMSGTLLYDAEQALREVGTRQAFDPRLDAVGHIPFSEAMFELVGDQVGRLVSLARKGSKKAVVVDADGTLWGGVVGEDGAAGIELDERGPGHGHLRLQSYLLELRRAGLFIALCSKNDKADVWSAFERREMRLGREHLAAWRVGWEPKSHYIREIAEELNIGLDAVVFLDDNPVEIAEVESVLPEVTCLLMPEDAARWREAVVASGWLDRLPPSREDLCRAEDVVAERARMASSGAATTPEEHLQSLGVRVSVRRPDPVDMARLAQLVIKTNQFNLNSRRRSLAELEALLAREDHIVRIVEVEDRFGASGIVGAYILQCDSGVILDTFLLSCRALGRRVEHAMLASSVSEAPGPVTVVVQQTERNEPVRRFFAEAIAAEVDTPCEVSAFSWPEHVELVGAERV